MNINKTVVSWVLGLGLSGHAAAGTMGPLIDHEANRSWSLVGSLGYTWYNEAYHGGPTADPTAQTAIGDGQTALGRFAIARGLGGLKNVRFGAELGVQSGNIMRLDIPQVTLDELGGLYPQLNIKPMLDLLFTGSWQPKEATPVFTLVKVGVAYRRLQVNDRVTFNDLSEAAFEVQAGLGYQINEKAALSLLYQGVFDGNTNYTINSTEYTGHINNIPSQNGLMLSLSYSV
jgi:opacity protein-like surface antigen